MKTLLLTPWYFPHKVIPWESAVTLVFKDKVDVVASYKEEIRSPSTSIMMPAVIRLRRHIGAMKKGVKFSRTNVFTRDKFRCQYCGDKFAYGKLTYDHVIPRKHGGRTEWDNIVTACTDCNGRKGDRSCDRAGMFPMTDPVRPKALPLTPPRLEAGHIPEEWIGFCAGVVEIG